METAELATVALLAIRDQRLGLLLPPQSTWRDLYGLRSARLELPAAPHTPGANPLAEALSLGAARFGCAASPLPSRWTYGSSPRHAVDRFPVPETAHAAPFLHIERPVPPRDVTDRAPRLTAIEVYRATLDNNVSLEAETAGALLWLPVGVLRQVVGGASLADVLRMDGAQSELPAATRLPDDTFIYLPSEYGERFLLRIAAKYGERALFTTSARAPE